TVDSLAAFGSSSRLTLLGVFHAARDDTVLRNFFVDWSDVVLAAAVMKSSHHGRLGAADYANDPALGAAVRPNCGDFHEHAISVHRGANRGRRNKNVTFQGFLQTRINGTGVGDNKAVAVAVHAEPARDHVLAARRLGRCIPFRIHLNELTAVYQPAQAAREFLAAIPVEPEFANQLFVAGRLFGLALDLLENGGIANSCQRTYLFRGDSGDISPAAPDNDAFRGPRRCMPGRERLSHFYWQPLCETSPRRSSC